MEYRVTGKDYLQRAKSRLSDGTKESMIYAALELRSGIEARLKEYFDAQAETTKKKRRGWQVTKLANQLEQVFRTGKKGVRLVIIDAQENTQISEVIYTPVTPKLRKMAERLGDYLHSLEKNKANNEDWWKNLRSYLEKVSDELEFACSGALKSPPLEHPKKPGSSFFAIEGDVTELFPVGKRIGMRIEYFEILDK